MKKPVRSVLLAVFAAGLAAAVPSQDEPDKQDPEVEQKLETLQEAVGDRDMERDQEAVRLIEELLVKYRAPMHRRDRRDVERTIAAVFDIGPRRVSATPSYRPSSKAPRWARPLAGGV